MHLVEKAAKVILDGGEGNAALDEKARLHWWSVSGRIVDQEDGRICLKATSNGNVVVRGDVKRVAAASEGVNAHAECLDAIPEMLPK